MSSVKEKQKALKYLDEIKKGKKLLVMSLRFDYNVMDGLLKSPAERLVMMPVNYKDWQIIGRHRISRRI